MTLEEFAMWINFYLDNSGNKNANVYVGKKLLNIKGFTPLYASYPLDKLLWLKLETQDDEETSDSDSNKMEKVELTEEQKEKLEKEGNLFSCFIAEKKDILSHTFNEGQLDGFRWALACIGYKLIEIGTDEMAGVEFTRYKLVKREIRRKENG